MHTARWGRGGLAVLVVGAAAAVIPIGGVARAAPPMFVDPPTRVYTSPGVDLPFAGDDAVTQQSKKIDVTFNGPTDSTCDVISQDEHSGNCAFAQIRILEAGRGAMTIDDSGIAYTSATQSGDNTFNIAGKFADIKSALESLVYVPPDDEFETTDDTPVTLEVSVQAPQPDPDSTSVQVDIRVEGANDPPDLAGPGDDPYEVNINETFSVSEAAGTGTFKVTDEDAQQDDNLPPDYLLGVAWLDCGTMTFVKPNQSPGLVAYEGSIEDMFAQLAADYQAIVGDPSVVVGQLGQNVTVGTGWDHVVAVGWMASLDADNEDFGDNFNEVMSSIDFHAPATPTTCTLTILVSDLGNNGMPLVGEVPNFAFDLDTAVFNVVDPNAPESTPPTVPEEPMDPESTPPTVPEEPMDPESTPPTVPEEPMDPESTPPDEDPPVSTECLTPAGGRCPPDDPGPGNFALSLVSTECSIEPAGRLLGPRRHVEPDAVHLARHVRRVRRDLRRLPHAVHRCPGWALLRSRLHVGVRRVARRRRGRCRGCRRHQRKCQRVSAGPRRLRHRDDSTCI